MPNNPPPRIVVIDDDREHLQYLIELLSTAGYSAVGFDDAPKAIEALARSGASLVITDIFMPNMDGFEVLRHVQKTDASIPVIAIDHPLPDGGEKSFLQLIQRMGAVAAISRPASPEAILAAVTQALGKH